MRSMQWVWSQGYVPLCRHSFSGKGSTRVAQCLDGVFATINAALAVLFQDVESFFVNKLVTGGIIKVHALEHGLHGR